MQTKAVDPATEHASRLFLQGLDARYDLAGAILYGSRARNDHQADSDADLAILLRGPKQRFLPVKLTMADVAFDVMLETGVNISPLPIWLEEWDTPQDYANPELLQNIRAEGIALI
jgi:uncharacterized protein